MTAKIHLENISVYGVDTAKRASTIRAALLNKKNLSGFKIPILQNITFQAEHGERIGILGANGSGKSSLLKVISGNYPIESGKMKITGMIAPLIEMGAGFDLELSGRENIKLSFIYRGRLRDYSAKLEQKIIEFSELREKIDQPLKNYSSGMAARLAFSSTIFQKFDILLLDEIFAAGDEGFIEKSQNHMLKQWKKASIAITVSHDIKQIEELCTRCIMMRHGKIVADGKTDDIIKTYHKEILAKC